MGFYGAEMWTLGQLDQLKLEVFERWCWRVDKNIL